MAELKPCPNCGNLKPICVNICSLYGGNGHKFYIMCWKCKWCGPTKMFRWRAKRAWNRRADNG